MSESLDTRRRPGRMVCTVLGAVAELERSLIVERVKAGLRNARAKGKCLGRARAIVKRSQDCRTAQERRARATICREPGLSKGTAQRAIQSLAKNDFRYVSATAAD